MTRVLTYMITRDSHEGVLLDRCDVWHVRPKRTRQGAHVLWIAKTAEGGHLGAHSLADCRRWFQTLPETDVEMIVCEQNELVPRVAAPKKAAR